MGNNISVNISSTENRVSGLINRIQTEIIDASRISKDIILNAVENSAGDFIDSLREEVMQEAAAMNLAGELLIAMADYIRSASVALASVDTAYNNSKV